MTDPATPAKSTSQTSDFDFMHGEWQVRHRKLGTRFAGAGDWYEFDGESSTRPVLGGAGNVEDNWLRDPAGEYRAVALRSFEAASGLWRIWWLDARFHEVDPPVIGAFSGDLGPFDGSAVLAGKPILVRFHWHRGDPANPRWEQAFSDDNGASWETNWIMRFRRSSAIVP